MEYRKLGNSGLKVSALSYGSWLTFGLKLDTKEAKELMKYCFDSGINFFDNAEIYEHGKSEEIMGDVLHQLKLPRDQFCVSSKVFWGGHQPTQRGLSKKHIHDGCHAALKRLKVDYLDMFFCHRPDIDTPIEETVWAMHNLVTQGKILYWGTSEWAAQEITQAHMVARQNNLTPPTMEQPEYNMFHREKMEKEYLRVFSEIGLGTTIWSPLASGILTGKYNDGIPKDSRAKIKGSESITSKFDPKNLEPKIEKVKLLKQITREIGCTLAQLALSWCLKNKNVSTVILGATKLEQLEENIKAIDIYHKLDDYQMGAIDEILQNKPEPPKRY